jgi:hypothetical protein
MYSEKLPSKVFVYEKGWVRVKPSQIQTLSLNKITSYSELLAIVKKYGYRCAAELVGFNHGSISDRYPISELAHMDTEYGEHFVNYLERLAEIDFKILQYFNTVLDLSVFNSTYDMWIKSKTGECLFRVNPFLGFNLESSFYGMLLRYPAINVVSFDNALWSVINKFHPEFKCNAITRSCDPAKISDAVKLYETVKSKYDAVSVKGWVRVMCGDDDAEWLNNNLTLCFASEMAA